MTTYSKPPTKVSTWREYSISIPAGSTIEQSFQDTTPNYFYIANFSSNVIYLGVSTYANATQYDAYVNPNDDNVYGRDVGYNKITLYNGGATAAKIKLISFIHEFDPTVLLNKTTVVLTQLQNLLVNVAASLPAGSNNIGHVNVDALPALPTGANVIGHALIDNFPATQPVSGNVGVTSLPALPTGANVIGHALIDNFPATQPVSGNVGVTSLPALPAGTNVIGHTIKDYAASLVTLANAVVSTAPQTFTSTLLAAGQSETLYVSVSAATTITVLVSPDNVNFYLFATWSPVGIASNAWALPISSYVRVVTSAAVTITAQLQVTQ